MSAERLRVYVVDDHPVVRRGLRTLLDSLSDVEVVGEASNGEQAVVSVAGAEPDVVVMDLNLPGLNGIEAARHSNIEVSRHLCLSAKTVRNHVSNTFTKLQVTDRANAVIRARDAGLG